MSASLWEIATQSGKLTTIYPVQTADLTVIGKLSVGVLSIDDIDASLSSLTGEITIKGDLVVTGSIKVLGSSAGKAVLPAGTTSLTIDSELVSTSSAIFTTPEEPVLVGAKATESGKFVIRIPEALPNDLKVNWWVVN